MESRTSTPNAGELSSHAPWIRSLALRLVRDAARADDLVQETLLAALEQRPQTGRSLRPWLRSVLNRRFAFGVRSEARRRERERESAPREELPAGRDLAEQAETHARLVRSLTRLRDPYRTVLLLRYYEGLMPGEIAQRLELPGATVRSHLKRGLAELRVELDGEHGGDRRAWCVALAPLAAGAPDAWTFTNPIASALQPLRAMHPLIHVIAASSALLLAGTFVADKLEGEPPLVPAAAESSEEVLELALAPGFEFVRAPGVVEAGSSELGGTSALLNVDEFITGYVRDSKTDAPLPGYVVAFRPMDEDGEYDECSTDETGRFETAVPYATGTELHVSLRDALGVLHVTRTQRQAVAGVISVGTFATVDPAQGPLEFKASVGPTFKLALDAPFEIDAEQLVATLESSERAPWGPLEISYQMRAPVRSGEPLWARFGLIIGTWFPADRPWLMRVESLDGLWAGEVEFAQAEGVFPETVAMELVPAARLEVEVLAPIEYEDLVVVAVSEQDGVRRLVQEAGTDPLADGIFRHRFQLLALAPGAYQLSVSSTGIEQDAGTVTLTGGQVHTETVELASGPALSHLRGELRSLSGQYKEYITLHLVGRNSGTQQTRYYPVWEERDGIWVAPFAFDNLPPDTYSIQPQGWGVLCWDTLPLEVVPPNDELVLTCRDTDPLRRVELLIRDATSGEAAPQAMAWLTTTCCNRSRNSMHVSTSQSWSFHDIPVDAPFSWWVKADGYVPCFGDESTLALVDGVAVIEVDLQPGWGARVEAFDATTSAPLVGVAVLFDGVLFGSTDAEGRIDLAAPIQPTHVDFQLEGWQADEGYFYDPVAHQLTGHGPTYSVRFSTEP